MGVTAPESVVKKIFAADKKIRFCALVVSDGKIVAGGMRQGSDSWGQWPRPRG